MKTKLSNIKYNKMLYDSKPVSFDEFVDNKYDKIHHQLYIDALSKFIKTLNDNNCTTIKEFKNKYNIIELKNDEYWKPSSIIYITKTYPYKKTQVDLTNFWNTYQEHKNDEFTNIKFTDSKYNIAIFELIGIDYINGKCKIRNKENNSEFCIPFNRLNKDIIVGEDYSLANLFSSKIEF